MIKKVYISVYQANHPVKIICIDLKTLKKLEAFKENGFKILRDLAHLKMRVQEILEKEK